MDTVVWMCQRLQPFEVCILAVLVWAQFGAGCCLPKAASSLHKHIQMKGGNIISLCGNQKAETEKESFSSLCQDWGHQPEG